MGPWGRFGDMIKYRLETFGRSADGWTNSTRCVVRSPADKVAVFAVQGFGRFGPFGPRKSNSEVRYQLAQDWGLVLWWPLVLIGVFGPFRLGTEAAPRGRAADGLGPADLGGREPGSSWPLTSRWRGTVTCLPIQAPNALLAAVGMSGDLGSLAAEGGGRREADSQPPHSGCSSSSWAATRSSGIHATGTPPAG